MLDWDRISELRGEVGDAEFQVILEMFLDEVESAMMRLSAKDPKRLEASLHFLKGCAWNLGFSAFGGLCDEEELRAASGQAQVRAWACQEGAVALGLALRIAIASWLRIARRSLLGEHAIDE